MLDEDTERDLLERVREHSDPSALARLVESHLRLVLAVARRFHREGVPMEDLVGEGMLGLVEAARRFDPDKRARFGTYATWWVRALVRRFALSNRRIVGSPSTRNGRKIVSKLRETERHLTATEGAPPGLERIAEALGVSLEEIQEVEAALTGRDVVLGADREDGSPLELACSAPSPEEQAAARQRARHTRASVDRGLAALDPREREIVERRLLTEDGQTLARLGESLGISRERVRQIELIAKDKMRAAMVTDAA
jgi:RNA polymerase sigma-32 factor